MAGGIYFQTPRNLLLEAYFQLLPWLFFYKSKRTIKELQKNSWITDRCNLGTDASCLDEKLNKDLVEIFDKLTLEPKPNPPNTDKKPDTETNNLDIEKLIWYSIDIINQDGMIIEPKLVPFIPGDDPKILLNEN